MAETELQQWLKSVNLGASAQSIAAHLAGFGNQMGSYPHDAGDFGRCEWLLNEAPELRPDMHRMAEVNAYWAALVPRWDEICQTFSVNQTALIKAITAPIQMVDPGHIQMSGIASMRMVANTFEQAEIAKAKKEKPMPAAGHNSGNVIDTYTVTADELRQFIERYEHLEAEKKDVAEQQKELMLEARGRGYDTKVMRKVVALRKRKPDEIAEEEAVLDIYKSALGMN